MTAQLINYDDKKTIQTLKNTVAQGASDEEFLMFANFCKSTGLNPFKKEVWFIKAGGRVQLMTGINGYRAIANNHPQFDGAEEELMFEDKKLIGATCKIYRKDRKYPAVGIALIAEYMKGSPIWKSSPSIMIAKCAESLAMRKAFPQELNGTYTIDEMPNEFAAPAIEVKQVAEQPTGPIYYSIPEVTFEQKTFLEKRGVEYDSDLGVWISPKDLGPKLAPYKLKEATIEQLAQLSKESKQEQITLAIEEQRVESGEV